MATYGRPLRFGFVPVATAADPARALRLAALAETLELDYVGIQDQAHDGAHLDPWTLLAAIGMKTERISLFTTMTDLSPRMLGVRARAAATLDLLAGGRFAIALGPGNETRGDQAPLATLKEAIELLRHLWRREGATHVDSKLLRLADMQQGPIPAHPISIWVAGQELPTLSLAGLLADGWLPAPYPTLQPSELAHLNQQIDEAAASAGREPSDIQRIWPIAGRIGDAESAMPFAGTAHQWAASLAELAVEVGIDTFLLMERSTSEGEDAEEQLRRFALEVVPRTRELVELAPGVAAFSGLTRAHQGARASGATPAEEQTDNVDWVDETSMESFPASDPPASASTA